MAGNRTARQFNGPSTGFDFKGMQEGMLRKRVGFRELARLCGIAEAKLRRIASGFVTPSSTEQATIITNLAEDSERE